MRVKWRRQASVRSPLSRRLLHNCMLLYLNCLLGPTGRWGVAMPESSTEYTFIQAAQRSVGMLREAENICRVPCMCHVTCFLSL